MGKFKILLCAICLFGLSAWADNIGVNFTSLGNQGASSSWNLGYEFTANTNSYATALGAFDYNQDGFGQAQQVGLWTSGGTLLASTYVTNSDALTNTYWRFHSIGPVALVAGQTYIVGSQGGEGYSWNNGGFTVAPEITFIKDRWEYLGNSSNNPLVFPTQTDNLQGFFGGNLMISDTTAVPEPGSLVLFGSGLASMAGMLRKKLRK